VKKYNNALMWF